MHGIYKLEENWLTYCWAHPNEKRPAEFKAEPGSRHTMVRLERFSTGEQATVKQLTDAQIKLTMDDEVGWVESAELNENQNPADYFPLIAKLKKIKSIRAVNVSDQSLATLAGLQHLTSLDLEGDQLTDNGLRIIPSLPKLSGLHLKSQSLTDDGLVHLTDLKNWVALSFKRTQITCRGLERLQHLPLRALTINNNELTGNDLEKIVSLFPNLRRLNLEDCEILDHGFSSLAKLSMLESLNLSGTSFDDQSMKKITQLSKLSNLYLDRTAITNETLATAARTLVNLQYFSAKGNSRITDEGLNKLNSSKSLIYFWASPGTFSPQAIKQFNNDAMKSRVYERR